MLATKIQQDDDNQKITTTKMMRDLETRKYKKSYIKNLTGEGIN